MPPVPPRRTVWRRLTQKAVKRQLPLLALACIFVFALFRHPGQGTRWQQPSSGTPPKGDEDAQGHSAGEEASSIAVVLAGVNTHKGMSSVVDGLKKWTSLGPACSGRYSSRVGFFLYLNHQAGARSRSSDTWSVSLSKSVRRPFRSPPQHRKVGSATCGYCRAHVTLFIPFLAGVLSRGRRPKLLSFSSVVVPSRPGGRA